MTRPNTCWLALLIIVAMVPAPGWAQQPDADLRDEAIRTLKSAASFFHEKVASHGGYVYYYSLDLRDRWGEGKATADTIFVQPPGTPTVGMAFLRAHAATGDRYYLDSARDAAEALVYGQLQSGGWTQTIHFGAVGPGVRLGKYRQGKGGSWNASTLDDDQTQSALQLLMRTDQALKFKNASIHEATLFGLNALLDAQFPNGAFPQVWTGPVKPQPVKQAKFPDYDWRTEGREKNYWDFYTLNDSLAGTVAQTLAVAHEVYGGEKYQQALERLGEFLILSQMPEPQPAWCQQYNYQMVPIWARKFEPPAVTGWESQDAMETLIKISRLTGNPKYLEPIPRALEYLKKSLLSDGRVARYYEFQTNKPLYMDAEYRLTHDDSDVPSHYGWKQPARLAAIERSYQEAKQGGSVPRTQATVPAAAEIRGIIMSLDQEGRWVTSYAGERLVGQPKFAASFRYLSSELFSRNVEALSAYIESRP